MSHQVEETAKARFNEWYAINSEQQRVLGPFRSEQECAQAVGTHERRRWDLVPVISQN
jgi:hypothetical protein